MCVGGGGKRGISELKVDWKTGEGGGQEFPPFFFGQETFYKDVLEGSKLRRVLQAEMVLGMGNQPHMKPKFVVGRGGQTT